MVGEVMIVNPRAKKRRRPMTAKQRKYFGPKRRRTIHVRRNPTAVAAAPTSKRRGRRRARVASFVSAARRRTRGVAGELGEFLTKDLMPAAIGAGGALAVDMVWPHLTFLPDSLQTGPLAPLVRIAGAVAVGMAVSAVGGKAMGRQAMAGALVVTVYDIAKGMMAESMAAPAPAATAHPVNAYVDGMGVYVDGLGYISPAVTSYGNRADLGVYAN
jgi:hypothetical protein